MVCGALFCASHSQVSCVDVLYNAGALPKGRRQTLIVGEAAVTPPRGAKGIRRKKQK